MILDLETRCWMLDARCWILDAGYWMLDTGCWMLDTGYWMLDARCWMFLKFCFKMERSFKTTWVTKQKNILYAYLKMFQVEGVLLSLKQYGAEALKL
jgi:hypothetical protein